MKNILELKLSGRVEAVEADPLASERLLDCSAALRWLAIGLESDNSNTVMSWVGGTEAQWWSGCKYAKLKQ